MSPKAVIGNSKHEYDQKCLCETCADARFKARNPHLYGANNAEDRNFARLFLATLAICVMLVAAGVIWINAAQAREGSIQPIPIPAAHAKARAACPARHPLACRAALVHAYEALIWTQKARRDDQRRAKGYGVNHALRLASALYNVPLRELERVGTCESHLHPLSKNSTSTASGLFQFLDSTWRRAGVPGFSVFDAYANAIAAARLVHTDHGWHEWSCQP